jgi:uncharacterized protein YndB with AHSA1/START domain
MESTGNLETLLDQGRVERETLLETDLERAWEAISDPDVLERWLADEVELQPVEGTPARFVVDGEERPGLIERVVEGRELAFSWEREPGRGSFVELELVPCIGGVWLRVTETDLSSTSPMAFAAWSSRLRCLSMRFCMVAV